MTASTAVAGTLWNADITGEITTLAVRTGDAPAIAVATEDGTCVWIDDAGTVTARTPTGVDVPTAIALHPTRDELTVTGPMGYARWQPGSEPEKLGRGWSSAAVYNRFGDLAVAVGKRVVIHPRDDGAVFTSAPAPSTVTALGWSPQANRVAASAYGGVYVFNGVRPDPVKTHPYLGSHLDVAVNPNGRWVCSGNQDASVHIWRTADNNELQMSGFPHKVTKLVFDSTGRWLANNGAPDIAVWDFIGKGPGGRDAQLLPGHDRVVDLDWRPGSGAVLASVGSEGSVRVWTLTTRGRGLPQVRPFGFGDALGARWLDADRLIVARREGTLTALEWPPA